jgi:predicted nucleotidyltransferase
VKRLFGSDARGAQNDQGDVDILNEMSADTEYIFDERLQLRDLLMQYNAGFLCARLY